VQKEATIAEARPNGSDEGDRVTHFIFQHKVFSLEQAHFAMEPRSREPVYYVRLGELQAVLPLPMVSAEFGIEKDSPDGKLLEVVAKSLRFVKEIRPNDSIPRELLDGSASWSVGEQHRLAAHARIVGAIAELVGARNLLDLLEEVSEEAKQRVRAAMIEAAKKSGLGAEAALNAPNLLEAFAREYAYIEGLRDRFAEVRGVLNALGQIVKGTKTDQQTLQDVLRVQALLRPPIADIEATFTALDSQTASLATILGMPAAQIELVRRVRDDIHFRLRLWDELIAKWQDQAKQAKESEAPRVEALVKETYRFAAFHFPQTRDWRRG
jgi:hypothetical protein